MTLYNFYYIYNTVIGSDDDNDPDIDVPEAEPPIVTLPKINDAQPMANQEVPKYFHPTTDTHGHVIFERKAHHNIPLEIVKVPPDAAMKDYYVNDKYRTKRVLDYYSSSEDPDSAGPHFVPQIESKWTTLKLPTCIKNKYQGHYANIVARTQLLDVCRWDQHQKEYYARIYYNECRDEHNDIWISGAPFIDNKLNIWARTDERAPLMVINNKTIQTEDEILRFVILYNTFIIYP